MIVSMLTWLSSQLAQTDILPNQPKTQRFVHIIYSGGTMKSDLSAVPPAIVVSSFSLVQYTLENHTGRWEQIPVNPILMPRAPAPCYV